MCLFGTVKPCSRFGWLCVRVCVLMTSEASGDIMMPWHLIVTSEGAMGVVLATSEASGGMGSDVRGPLGVFSGQQ